MDFILTSLFQSIPINLSLQSSEHSTTKCYHCMYEELQKRLEHKLAELASPCLGKEDLDFIMSLGTRRGLSGSVYRMLDFESVNHKLKLSSVFPSASDFSPGVFFFLIDKKFKCTPQLNVSGLGRLGGNVGTAELNMDLEVAKAAETAVRAYQWEEDLVSCS